MHEQALAGVDGVERPGPGGERRDLGFDAEQLGEERFERRAERDQQLPLGLGVQRLGRGPGGEKGGVKGRVLLFEPGEEEAIEPDQAVPVPQIVKGEPEAERLFHTCLVGVHLPEPSCTMWGTPRPIWP